MHCIDLTSKRSKLLSYVPKRRKWSNYNGLHRFDIKTIQNVEIRRKTFKQRKPMKVINYNAWHRFDVLTIKTFWVLSQNDESDQIIVKSMPCIIIDHFHWFALFECFATYLNILDCFDVKSMQSIVIWSLSSFRDVTQKFWSFRRQIDAMHYNLITFVVLRQNSKSFDR